MLQYVDNNKSTRKRVISTYTFCPEFETYEN